MHKTEIRALILDYGGVISLPQKAENVANICRTLNLEQDEFMRVYLNQRGAFDIGRIRAEAFWHNVLREFGLESSNELIPYLIQEDILSWTELNDAVIQFISEIREKIFKLAVISNMPIDVLESMRNNFQWFESFDVLVFSCDVGVNKPDIEIYEYGLRELEIPPGDCLFVDDSIDNVRAAMDVGMHAIHFRTFSDFYRDFIGFYSPLPAV